MKKKVSLKDIAQQLGVSTALVSYVLNNKKEGRISQEIADKIRKVASELNYTTNEIAKSLKTRKTFTIGIILSDISNPFSSALARIIEDEAEKKNYTVIFGSSDEKREKMSKLINVLVNRQVDGLIVAASEEGQNEIRRLKEMEVPVVLIDRYFPELTVSHVVIDNYKASFSAVHHLITKGFRRIGMVTYNSSLIHLEERKQGYLAALREYKIDSKEDWVREVSLHNSRQEVENAVNHLLSISEPVDAILFASNVLSSHGLKYINTLNITVPDNVAIVSFDESDASQLFYAPLTHIKQPLYQMGYEATRILIDEIENNTQVIQLKLEAELVVGKSSVSGDNDYL